MSFFLVLRFSWRKMYTYSYAAFHRTEITRFVAEEKRDTRSRRNPSWCFFLLRRLHREIELEGLCVVGVREWVLYGPKNLSFSLAISLSLLRWRSKPPAYPNLLYLTIGCNNAVVLGSKFLCCSIVEYKHLPL